VVLNEVLFNPEGDDNANMPNGEWVELFNNSAIDVDVNGWYIQDNTGAAHRITVAASNSDNNLNTGDSGETIVPTGGRLVVYRNNVASFDNTADTISLYNAANTLIDSVTYTGAKAEGMSLARIPDGIGGWIDPVANPGTPNAANTKDLITQVKLWQQDANNVWFAIFDAQDYASADYIVTYTHVYEGADVREAVQGKVNINGQSRVKVEKVYLATCSEGGLVCVPHTGIKLVGVEVELRKTDGTTKVLQYDYPNTWSP
jgi:hypothetical protein